MKNKIIIVSLNPAIDKTSMVEDLLLGKTNIAKSVMTNIGGKGINVALSLKNLSIDFLLTGILGGNSGAFLKRELGKQNIRFSFFEVENETRTNHKIYSKKNKTITEINELGEHLSQLDYDRFVALLMNMLDGCEILVLSGSLPEGFPLDAYFKIIKNAKKRNIRVILDTNGENLANSIDALPFAIKPNKDELEVYANRKLDSLNELIKEMEKIEKRGVDYIITSLGKEGAILVNKGRIFQASSYEIETLSTVGAGDSMVAAMVYCMIKKLEVNDMLRWMVAFSTVTSSYGPGLFSSSLEAQKSLNRIKIKEIFTNDLYYL